MVVGAGSALSANLASSNSPQGSQQRETSGANEEAADHVLISVVCALLFLSIVFQQIALPVIGIPMTLGLFWLCIIFLWVTGKISLGRRRLIFASVVSFVVAISLFVWLTFTPDVPSIFSLAYVSACWIPFLFVVPNNKELTNALTKTYLWTVGVLALVAIIQFSVQVLGGPFWDLLSLVPREYIIPNYVHRARLEVPGFTALIRSNGMVFLEPSIASQFFALGAVLALRSKPALVPIFLLATVFTGSGTGLIALAVGLMGVAMTGRIRERLLSLFAVALGAIVLAVTGLAETMFSRSSEFQSDGTSASFRFIDPWDHLGRFLADTPDAALFGIGPGGVSYTALSYGIGVNYTFTPKMIIEYGLLLGLASTLVIFLFILKSVNLSLASRLTLIAMTFALSGALGQPASAILLWCLCQPIVTTMRGPSPGTNSSSHFKHHTATRRMLKAR